MNSSSMSRRDFLQTAATTVGAASLGGLLAACSGLATTSTSKNVTIAYWDWWQSQAPWVDNEIKLFQQAHPNITVKKTTQVFADYSNLFGLAEQSNRAPDTFQITFTPDISEQVQQGWLMPLDKWADSAWRSKFPDGTFYEGSNIFSGKLYSAPFTGSAPSFQLYIHNGVFKSAGLVNADGSVKLPKTWDDVGNFAATITQKGGGNVYGLGFGNSTTNVLSWLVDVLVRGAGSPGGSGGIDYRVGKWTQGTDRNYMDVINLLLDWKKKGYIYPDAISTSDEASRALFERGKFGMTIGGVWNQAEWTQHNFTDYSLTTLIAPQETPQGYFYKTPGGYHIAMSAKTKFPEESWAWLNWYYSPEAGKRWVAMGEDLSIFQQNNDPKIVKFAPFAAYVALAPLAIDGPAPAVRDPQTSHVVQQVVKPGFGDVYVGVYTGQIQDIQGTLSDTAGRYQKSLTDGIAQAVQGGFKVSLDDYIFSDWDITKPYKTAPAS